MEPTRDTYAQLNLAYNHFNNKLFGGKLPGCLITLHRKKNAYGYFWGDMWSEREGRRRTDEIALNPELFGKRTTKDILSTLAHEMCHLQQHHFGKPSRSAYHNREWADMMIAIGLTPSDTGQPKGKQTGQRVSHYIAENGLFDRVADALLADGFTIPWQAINRDELLARKKAASKTKYTCIGCSTNAWAKPDTKLICGACMKPMIAREAW